MFERPKSGEVAVLVHVNFPASSNQEDLQEFQELAISAGAVSVAVITATRHQPEAKYFVGSGKADEIRQCVAANQAELVIFNHSLSPAQERNLERLFNCRVVDRTGLILDIFAQRARTFEGKLQVELAQLQHMSTRLVRGWTHLERQKGGIGLRGPGETQLETDRRLLRARIQTIRKRLEKVRQQRDQGRRARRRSGVPVVSLVGYTNAGKSTLFNYLTGGQVYVADQLFATLDPTLRRIELPTIGPVIIADTVGFIRHLPHDLVEAFRATLEETLDAELLLHVIDAHHEERLANIEQVEQVLKQIGADNIPQLQIYNKVDLLDGRGPLAERDVEGDIRRVWLSAVTGAGTDLLQQALVERLGNQVVTQQIVLMPTEGQIRSTLYNMNAVKNELVDDQGNWVITISLPAVEFKRLFSKTRFIEL